MAALPVVDDDLDRLVGEVRKTIRENQLFLKSLADDSVDGSGAKKNIEEEQTAEEDFEEL